MEISFSFPKTDFIQSHCDISGDGHNVLTTTNGFNSNGCEVIVRKLQILGSKATTFRIKTKA